jgi:lipid-binding SYLF domain-containing protein
MSSQPTKTTSEKGEAVSADRARVDQRLKKASQNLSEITNAPDKGIPETVLAKAKCVAIVPDLVKGGFVFGAQHGRGVATCRTSAGWSSPAFFTLTGGSWGAQIGAEEVDLVMLFMDEEGTNKLMDANFKIGADASAAAGPVGREASASTDVKMKSQVLTYSRAKGAFVGITLDGASVRQDDDSTKAFYGQNYDFRALLTGQVLPPAQATPFLASVRRDFREAVASEH